MLELATCEPYFSQIHGGDEYNGYIVIYSYSLEEFYMNAWISELKRYMMRLVSTIKTRNYKHLVIQNYSIVLCHINKLQLVQIMVDDTNREMCILHTYKINIFKKIWKKHFYNKIKNSLNTDININKL
jgi:hypothetical protein